LINGGFRGGAGSGPILGDGLTPPLTILLICDNGTVLMMATPSPVYLIEHVKHGTQNIQNDCHQWLCDSFRAHQIRFRPGLGVEEGKEEKWRDGRYRPLFANSGICPC